MSNNRFNKPAPQQYQPREERKKEEEIKLNLKPCLKCGKAITTGYYSHIESGGLCSKKCNDSFNKPSEIDNENFTRVNSFNGPIFSSR